MLNNKFTRKKRKKKRVKLKYDKRTVINLFEGFCNSPGLYTLSFAIRN